MKKLLDRPRGSTSSSSSGTSTSSSLSKRPRPPASTTGPSLLPSFLSSSVSQPPSSLQDVFQRHRPENNNGNGGGGDEDSGGYTIKRARFGLSGLGITAPTREDLIVVNPSAPPPATSSSSSSTNQRSRSLTRARTAGSQEPTSQPPQSRPRLLFSRPPPGGPKFGISPSARIQSSMPTARPVTQPQSRHFLTFPPLNDPSTTKVASSRPPPPPNRSISEPRSVSTSAATGATIPRNGPVAPPPAINADDSTSVPSPDQALPLIETFTSDAALNPALQGPLCSSSPQSISAPSSVPVSMDSISPMDDASRSTATDSSTSDGCDATSPTLGEDEIGDQQEVPPNKGSRQSEGDSMIDEDFPWRNDAEDIRNFMIHRPVASLRPPPPIRHTPKPCRYWRYFARHHQLGTCRSRTRSAILQVLMHRVGPLPGGLQAQTVRGQESPNPHTATAMAFDSMGSLLAVGVNSGSVRVYDYDEYRASVSRITSKTSSSASATSSSSVPLPPSEEDFVPPLFVLPTGRSVASIKWNPSDETQLAVSFHHWNEVHLFSLDSDRPTSPVILRPQSGQHVRRSGGGNLALTFFLLRGGASGVVAGGVYGMLRAWDPNRPQQLLWEVKTKGGAAVRALCDFPGCLIAASAELITIWDTHNLQVPCLGVRPSPVQLRHLEIASGPCQFLPLHTSPEEVLSLSQNGLVHRIPLRSGSPRVVACTAADDVMTMTYLSGKPILITTKAGTEQNPGDRIVIDSLSSYPLWQQTTQESFSLAPADGLCMTLPGTIVGVEDNGRVLRCSDASLHRYLASYLDDDYYKAKRADIMYIDHQAYCIKGVSHEDDATLLHLKDPLPTTTNLTGKTMQTAIQPVFHHGPTSSSTTQTLRRLGVVDFSPSPEAPIRAVAINPATGDLVVGLEDGRLSLLGFSARIRKAKPPPPPPPPPPSQDAPRHSGQVDVMAIGVGESKDDEEGESVVGVDIEEMSPLVWREGPSPL